MSKEVELPPIWGSKHQILRNLIKSLISEEWANDFDEIISQIDTLNAQVEDLNEQREELAALGSEWAERARRSEAELAALREGATVTYRIDYRDGSGVWHQVPAAYAEQSYPSIESANEGFRKLYAGNHLRIVEVITHERILDADGGESK